MRGKVFMRIIDSDGEGITPAYAGKRPVLQDSKNDMEDHPRLCGEKSPLWYNNRRGEGSPPPMRGKGNKVHFPNTAMRITPAYAGKSDRRSTTNFRRRDHPRLCGEKLFVLWNVLRSLGSPPPMRGKVPSGLT